MPGDVMRVRAGDIIPAGALVINASDSTANEAAFTGEPYPVEKRPGAVTGNYGRRGGGRPVPRGRHSDGGSRSTRRRDWTCDDVRRGGHRLGPSDLPSPLQRDLGAYGLPTARLTMALVVIVLAINVFFGRPLMQSLLFAVALAVGLTPELLPMITTVTLSRGAVRMAKRKVIVKRLAAIQDLGAMMILCTGKTGTFTSAEIHLARSTSPAGVDDARPSRLGAIAATVGGDRGAMDAALM